MGSICGVDCNACQMKQECKGCKETNAHPFGGSCLVASCCKNSKNCKKTIKEYKSKTIDEINSLNIKGMPKVTVLYELKGSFINLEYILPSGQNIKFWQDNNIYLGAQLEVDNYCFGVTASEEYILICKYEENGSNPKIVLFKERE